MNMIRRWTAFNLVGAAGIAVQVGVIAFLVRVCGWHYLPATALAVEAAVLHNFAWHQRWTWNDRPAGSWPSLAARFLRFQMVNGAISLAGNLMLMRIMAGLFNMDAILANITAIAVCATLNFAASEAVVFRSVTLVLMLAAGLPSPVHAQGRATLTGWEQYQTSLDGRYASENSGSTFFVHDRQDSQRDWRDTVRAGESGSSSSTHLGRRRKDSPLGWRGLRAGHHARNFAAQAEAAGRARIGVLRRCGGVEAAGSDGDRLRVFMKLRRDQRSSPSPTTPSTSSNTAAWERRVLRREALPRGSPSSRMPGTPREREKTGR